MNHGEININMVTDGMLRVIFHLLNDYLVNVQKGIKKTIEEFREYRW